MVGFYTQPFTVQQNVINYNKFCGSGMTDGYGIRPYKTEIHIKI